MESTLTEKQKYWTDKLQQAESSGHSLAEYARLNNIPAQKLYQWRSTLKKQETTTEVSTEHHFSRVITTSSISLLTLQLPQAQLKFTTLPDPAWLSEFLNRHSVHS